MTLLWTMWLVLIALSFAAFETYALKRNKTTLSRYVWTVSKYFPLFPFLIGLLAGTLATHFWWGGIVCFSPVK